MDCCQTIWKTACNELAVAGLGGRNSCIHEQVLGGKIFLHSSRKHYNLEADRTGIGCRKRGVFPFLRAALGRQWSSGVRSNRNWRAGSLYVMAGEKELRSSEPEGIQLCAEEIAEATGGEVLRDGGRGGFCTDTRTLKAGDWFVPLVGPNYDGHDFLQTAQHTGCVGALGHPGTMPHDWSAGFVQVPDTLKAFQDLASFARKRYQGPVVGITGSSGKTSTRAMVGLALRSLGPVHQTSGNLNNHIGVPRTLLDLDFNAAACVLELGMNHAGEIALLADICRPTVRVVLNVGPVHIGNLGSMSAIAAAKGELFDSSLPGDVCVLNADDPLVSALPVPSRWERNGPKVVRFGRSADCDVRLVSSEAVQNGEAVRAVIEAPDDHPPMTCQSTLMEGSEETEERRNLGGGTVGDSSTLQAQEGEGMQMRESENDGERSGRGGHAGISLRLQENVNVGNLQSGASLVVVGSAQGGIEERRARDIDPGLEVSDGGEESVVSVAGGRPSLGRRRVEVVIPSPGLHLAENACAAVAVAWALGVRIEDACNALSDYVPVGQRMRLEHLRDRQIRLIDDSYNSNPVSLLAALKLLANTPCRGRRIALIGDMFELGNCAENEHRRALEACFKLSLDVIGVAGQSFSKAVRDAEQEVSSSRGASLADSEDDEERHEMGTVLVEPDALSLAKAAMAHVRDGDLVLVKGSRGMKMEIVANALRSLK